MPEPVEFPQETPVAYGRTAEIYAWGDHQVLKLYHEWFPLEHIQFEQSLAQAVYESGLPVPAPGEIVQIDERHGLIFERVAGIAMWDLLARKPWLLFTAADRMAELHTEMHSTDIQVDLPSQRQRLEHKISMADALPTSLRDRVLAALERLPHDKRLCHGDFHPGNIMVHNGKEVIIDWIDASLGNPHSDVARTTIIAIGAVENDQVPGFFAKMGIRLFHRRYLRRYFSLLPGDVSEYRRWLPIVAAARMSEGMPELEEWLYAQVERGLT